MERKRIVEEIHKQARRNYLHRRYDYRDINETFQADIVDTQAYAKENNGFRKKPFSG